jgi:mannose-6-phosphate isomerase-like protein (cupin superfamily)
MESVRRVVTGVREDGRSVIVSDEVIHARRPPILNGNEVLVLFGEDEVPTSPHAGEHVETTWFPPRGGYRFLIFSYPPHSRRVIPDDLDAAIAESERIAPGLAAAVTDGAAMHHTYTVDLEYVLEGEFTLTLDSGESTVLRKGDVLVQCGSKHAWANDGDGPATMLLVFVGAEPAPGRYA